MDIKKLLTGGIAAGVLFFFLGWLTYGMLLRTFFMNHSGMIAVDRPDKDLQFLYLSIGNLAMGFALAFIFVKANVNSLASGLVMGGLIGLLFSVGINCMTYATTYAISKMGMAAAVATDTLIWAVSGAVVGALMGMGKKSA